MWSSSRTEAQNAEEEEEAQKHRMQKKKHRSTEEAKDACGVVVAPHI
jgi:hypothetical protein